MNRRDFLSAFLAAPIVAAVPALAFAEPVELVQYDEYFEFGPLTDATMPVAVREKLDAWAKATAATLGLPLRWNNRQYAWFPHGYADKSDPLGCLAAIGAIKFHVEEPRSLHDARTRDTIAAGGWLSVQDNYDCMGKKPAATHPEFADFRKLDGKTRRYGRWAPGSDEGVFVL